MPLVVVGSRGREPTTHLEPSKAAVNDDVENIDAYGSPGAASNGHNENRALFATGHCAISVDATSAADDIDNPDESQVADKTAFTAAPVQVADASCGWFTEIPLALVIMIVCWQWGPFASLIALTALQFLDRKHLRHLPGAHLRPHP